MIIVSMSTLSNIYVKPDIVQVIMTQKIHWLLGHTNVLLSDVHEQFLEEVGEIQRKAAEEEQKRLEAELLAKQKKTGSRKGSVKA